jgi:hypothetical protein
MAGTAAEDSTAEAGPAVDTAGCGPAAADRVADSTAVVVRAAADMAVAVVRVAVDTVVAAMAAAGTAVADTAVAADTAGTRKAQLRCGDFARTGACF